MMKRDECFRILARHVTDEIVIASYSSAAEWNELNPRVLNYFSVGAMGLASSHGLGLALGRPDKRVLVLDGDGSLPMNLVHFVCHNGTYEANGGHPIPNPEVDFSGMARASGYAQVHEFSELASFEQQIGHVLAQDGPVFATLKVERSRPLSYDYPTLYAADKRKAIKAA